MAQHHHTVAITKKLGITMNLQTRTDALKERNIQLQLKRLGCRVNWLKLVKANIIIHMTKTHRKPKTIETIGGPY